MLQPAGALHKPLASCLDDLPIKIGAKDQKGHDMHSAHLQGSLEGWAKTALHNGERFVLW